MNSQEKKLHSLDKKISGLFKIRNKLSDKIEKENTPKYRKNIGRCYIYSNSYGNKDERWPLYHKILDYKDGGYEVLKFEIRSDDFFTLEITKVFNSHFDCDSYTEVSQGQFDLNFNIFIDKMKQKGVKLD